MQRNLRIVVKVGTKVITSEDRMLDKGRIKELACQLAKIRDEGVEVILVTSGAIGAGMSLLNVKRRPSNLSDLQAVAAIGQNYLMRLYSEFFKKAHYLTGQILLTQDDFNDRKRYLNIKHTVNKLLEHKAVPIINENDTVGTEEIRCGDNDRLSSLVSDLCGAERLIILSDVDGLLDEKGNVIKYVDEITSRIIKLGGKSHCDLGTGGMATKIEAARITTKAGIECVIANGKENNILYRIAVLNEDIGTTFQRSSKKFIAKKRWIAYSSKPKGAVSIDSGAKRALLERGSSLLASGILSVVGDFIAGDVVRILDNDKKELARGVTNYSSNELAEIKGRKTGEFIEVLGYKGQDEIIHKDNLVIL